MRLRLSELSPQWDASSYALHFDCPVHREHRAQIDFGPSAARRATIISGSHSTEIMTVHPRPVLPCGVGVDVVDGWVEMTPETVSQRRCG